MTDLIELYHHQTAACARKVRLALAEKNICWTGHIIDIWNGQNLQPAYLKVNPNGVVPTLLHNGIVFFESTVINEYLEETFPSVRLMPPDSWGKAQVRLWTKRVDEAIHPASASLTFAMSTRDIMLKKSPEELELHLKSIPDPGRRARQQEAIGKGLDASVVHLGLQHWQKLVSDMQRSLASSRWLVGEMFSLADISLAPYFFQLKAMNAEWTWEETSPEVCDWYSRLCARASFRTAIEDYLLESRTRQLLEAGKRNGSALRDVWAKVIS